MSQEEASTNVFHPRLNEDGSFKPKEETDARGGEVGLEGVQTAPLSNPEEVTIPEPPVTPDNQAQMQKIVYQIPRENMYQELRRLASEDPEFDKTVKEYAGRKVRREIDDENRRLKTEVEVLQRTLKERAIAAMPQDEIDRRMATDPEFAKDFVDLVHGDGSDLVRNSRDLDWASRMEAVQDEMLDTAIGLGMPKQRVDQFQAAWTTCPLHNTSDHGFFDHDEKGNFFDAQYGDSDAAYAASIEYFKKVVQYDINELARIRSARRNVPPPGATTPPANVTVPPPSAPPAQPVPQQPRQIVQVGQPNPNIASRNPDLTNAASSAPSRRFTSEEIAQWTPDQRMEFFEKFPGGRKEAIETGAIYVKGLSESLGFTR